MRVFNINFDNNTSTTKKSFWFRTLFAFIAVLICLLLFNSVKIDSIPTSIAFATFIALCNSCCKFVLKISSVLASILITFIIAIFADNIEGVELKSFISTWSFTIGVYVISFLISIPVKVKKITNIFSQPMKNEDEIEEVEEGFTSYEEVIEEDNDEEFNKNNNL
jgi:hypothetical protein